ncbi:hypothetical protein E5358_13200 [Palleniella muris]|uniref:Uncharacterized protein n=1 Tax=Palleniella muris TaxID=3038145 RepID=A0AC61QNL8_9BACT|nr:acyltransferase family protein [Palleniella muris]TGX80309.1 hypothetical protein E5358_13200 [Palleniella muris]
MSEQHNNFIVTYLKATGIILMVIGHSGCSVPYAVQIIYMFHMPLFFFVSGFCFKPKYLDAPLVFIWRKTKGIYIPYVKWSLLFLALHNVFFAVNIYNNQYGFTNAHVYSVEEITQRAMAILTTMSGHDQLLGGYWFLNALFFGSLMAFGMMFLMKKIGGGKKESSIIGGVFLFVVTLLVDKYDFWFPVVHIGAQATIGGTFFMIGHVFSAYNIRQFNVCMIIVSLVALVIGSFLWSVSLADGSYVNFSNKVIVPYMITAVLIVWSLYSLPWHRLNDLVKSIFEYIGENTMTVLTWHFLCFKFVSLWIICIYGIDIKHLGEFPVLHYFAGNGWWIVYVISGILLPLSLTYGCQIVRKSIFKEKHIV